LASTRRAEVSRLASTNNLILNFKAAALFRASLNERERETLTFVPIPPSKARGDPLYDDRLEQMLRRIWPGQATDVRELVTQPVSTPAVHDSADRPTPAVLEGRYVIDRRLRDPAPQVIAVLDDVITTSQPARIS
jgi:hypothetical protein